MRRTVLVGALAALALPLLSGAPALTAAAATTASVTDGAYTAVSPARLLDTRSAVGVTTRTPVGAGSTVSLQVTGRGGVPLTGVRAVVLNIAAVSPTAAGYLTAYPAGQTLPATSSLNFGKGATRANLITIPVGTGGKVNIRNAVGSTHVIADVMGYYLDGSTTPTTGSYGSYQSVTPGRVLDTRSDPAGPLVDQDGVDLPIDFGATDSPHVKAVAVNVTAVNPTAPGYFTAWDGVQAPTTSTVNYLKGQNTPNMAIVPVTKCTTCPQAYSVPQISIINRTSGSAHLLVDVVGFMDDDYSGSGLRFRSIGAPQRIVDSRSNTGTTPLGANQTHTITAPSSVTTTATGSLVANVTGVSPTANTFLTLWPNVAGTSRPTVSNLNPAKGTNAANMAMIDVGDLYDFNVYNYVGTVNLIIDVTGTMEFYSTAPTPTTSQRSAAAAGSAGSLTRPGLTPQRVGGDVVHR